MIKHVSYDNYLVIQDAAWSLASLERGCRQQKRKEAEIMTTYLKKCAHEVKTLPKNKQIHVVFNRSVNLSTYSKWSDYCTAVLEEFTDADCVVFTDASVIIRHKYSGTRTVIDNRKILAFVW